MTRLKGHRAAALLIFVGAFGLPAQTQAAGPQCRHTLEQYIDYARRLAPIATRARQQADENPLYESDAQYYAAELADARQCVKTFAPIATAFR